MTCIVGLVADGAVYIGGDSAGVSGLDLVVRADAKVFRNGPCLFGFTSSFRMGQLLRYSLNVPQRHPDVDVMKWLCSDFIDAVRSCLKNGGFASKDSETERGGHFLLGYAGRLFHVGGDYQVGEGAELYEAVGCGESFALGAMYASKGMEGAEARVRLALEAAQAHSAGVCGPFVIEKL